MNKLIKNNLHEDHIFLDVEAKDRYTLLREMTRWLDCSADVVSCEQLAEDAITREEELPTGLPGGFALPHARSRGVKKMVIAFARLRQPVDFQSPDGDPTDLVFFSAIPVRMVDEYLKLTAYLVRLLSLEETRNCLRNATTAAEVREILGAKD